MRARPLGARASRRSMPSCPDSLLGPASENRSFCQGNRGTVHPIRRDESVLGYSTIHDSMCSIGTVEAVSATWDSDLRLTFADMDFGTVILLDRPLEMHALHVAIMLVVAQA